MLVKRYHANDMQQAMDTVIKELGSDAVILNSRKMRKKGFKNLFRKPILEVMVAYDPANVPAVKKLNLSQSAQYYGMQPPKEQESIAVLTPPLASSTVSSEQLERLDGRIDSIDSMLNEFIEKFSFVKRDITYDYVEEVQELLQRMIENQVREELAHSLAKETENMLRNQPDSSASEILEHLILERFGKPAPILHKKFTQKVILVMGPTGVGKTTTIVKLAADFAVKQKKKIGIINTDTFRIGAQEQLQTYADIMGIPLQVVYQSDELEGAMEAMSDRDVVFVDTAGKRPGDEQHKEDILDIVRILKPEDILLCLAATTGFSALKEMVDTYGFVEDYRLLITKLDETKYRGILLNLSWYTQKPIAYVTTGQNVPDDIEVVDVEAVTKQIIKE
ncbi:MAG: flagellar biosynthesis protein FlhF [Oscillospiraceae bacterium]|nr:flagellar biosynthesis protein FlhF [Oscillospiraceae bacterium]